MSIKKMPPIATTYFLLFSVDKYVTKGGKKDSGPAFQRFLRKFIFYQPQNTIARQIVVAYKVTVQLLWLA